MLKVMLKKLFDLVVVVAKWYIKYLVITPYTRVYEMSLQNARIANGTGRATRFDFIASKFTGVLYVISDNIFVFYFICNPLYGLKMWIDAWSIVIPMNIVEWYGRKLTKI